MHPSYPLDDSSDSNFPPEAILESSLDTSPMETFENMFDFESGFDWVCIPTLFQQ